MLTFINPFYHANGMQAQNVKTQGGVKKAQGLQIGVAFFLSCFWVSGAILGWIFGGLPGCIIGMAIMGGGMTYVIGKLEFW